MRLGLGRAVQVSEYPPEPERFPDPVDISLAEVYDTIGLLTNIND